MLFPFFLFSHFSCFPIFPVFPFFLFSCFSWFSRFSYFSCFPVFPGFPDFPGLPGFPLSLFPFFLFFVPSFFVLFHPFLFFPFYRKSLNFTFRLSNKSFKLVHASVALIKYCFHQIFDNLFSVLRENTTFQIGWSYVLAWMGIGFSLLSSIAYIAAKFSIRNDIKVKTKMKTTIYNELSLEIVVQSLIIVPYSDIDAQSFSHSFEGVHGVVRKSGRGSSIFVFNCIFMLQFFKVF
jgi:hypothetical protein